MSSSRMQRVILILLLIFAVGENADLVLQRYLQWKFMPMNRKCIYPMIPYVECRDIRACPAAKAALAMGSWPSVCGWISGSVPKVCCARPLVFGKTLMKKIDEEKARKRRCGTTSFEYGLSETENKFSDIENSLPPLDTSDPNKFDPPLAKPQVNQDPAVGGHPARQGLFPWMVSIKRRGNHWCGGTLIDRKHILSAAHCFAANDTSPDPTEYSVHIGNIYVEEGYPVKVKKIEIHPQYQISYHYHDISVLTLNEEILSPWIAHICLPSPELAAMDLTGKSTSLLGWGHTSFQGKPTSVLHIVDNLPIVSFDQCKTAYRRVGADMLPKGLTEDFICAGLEDGGKDACQMDSGGPLMYKYNFQKLPSDDERIPWVQIGVVSFGFMCGESGFPGVYIKIANYMDWLTVIMNE